jgi:urease accessory protein
MPSRITLAVSLMMAATPVSAHDGAHEHGSLLSGVMHPISGFDHVLAMVTVGLLAAQLGGRAIWSLPLAFVATMALGFVAALWVPAIPLVEPLILTSVVGLGLLVALAWPVPRPIVVLVVAFFAFFHGAAHGTEVANADLTAYAAGFTGSTVVLHFAGITLGLGVLRAASREHAIALTRAFGGLAALAGLGLAAGL